MTPKTCVTRIVLGTGIAIGLALAPVLAAPPEWAGQDKGQSARKGKAEKRFFDSTQRTHVHTYYAKEFRSGACPPGLAKKHNGCLPPGQAKKQWRMGQPLPGNVVLYELPPALVVRIGAPPPGYKYVRIASDILVIAVGTMLVVDAINDIGKR